MRQLPSRGASLLDMIQAIRQLIDGRGNNTGSVTLRASETTTTVARTNGNAGAAVFLQPTTATAAAAAATTYVSAVTADGFTVSHASEATTDRTYFYVVVGG